MAITITQQPNAGTFQSSEYPLVIKATSNTASLRFLKFEILDSGGSAIAGIPAYYAPLVNSEYSFNASDYINGFLSWDNEDKVSFDATPTVHVYDSLAKSVKVKVTEITTSLQTSATAESNTFTFAKFKHQVYNSSGTAQEYIETRKALSSMPYHIDSFGNLVYAPSDGRMPFNILTDYSRVSCYLKSNQSIDVRALTGTSSSSSVYAEINISQSDLTSNGAVVNKINSVPVNISDLQALSSTGWQIPLGGGATTVSNVEANYKSLGVLVLDVANPPSAVGTFVKPSEYRIPCPKTFIYVNRFGVHESITFSSKENQSIVSSRDNASLVSTDPYGAHSSDLGAYFLTGARQRAVNPRSEREFTIKNTVPIPHEQAQEIALDFFASPYHYVVDEGEFFAPSATISHPDTGTQKIKRISINDGTVNIVNNNRATQFEFTYRYSDLI
jgi:hypothetical protein